MQNRVDILLACWYWSRSISKTGCTKNRAGAKGQSGFIRFKPRMLLAAVLCVVAAAPAPAATVTPAASLTPAASPTSAAKLEPTGSARLPVPEALPSRPQASGSAWTAGEIAKLHSDVDTLLATDRSVRGAHVGVLAVDARTGNILYERNAADEFQPASTLKLIVGSFALEKLGSGFQFHTSVERVGERLVLRAGGDPFLSSSDLVAAAQSVANAGVRRVSDVAVDASRYDTAPYPAGWVWDDFGYDYAAQISAAALDENVASYSVGAGVAVGDAVRIGSGGASSHPPSRCPGLIVRATTAAAGTPATLDTQTLRPDCTAITGSLPLWYALRASVDVAVADPIEHLRTALRAALSDPSRGIVIGDTHAKNVADGATGATGANGASDSNDASVRAGTTETAQSTTEATQAVWRHDSEPLRAWLGPNFWIPSDNFVAEQTLCEVGLASVGAPGSTEGGLAAERAWLNVLGIDVATVTLADGSGLSQYDRVTPRVLVAVLQHDWNGPNRQLVLDSLPIGGVRGTIEGIAGTPAAGRVFAKTGSMSHVRGLAGYLASRRHGAVTFALNVDDWNGDYTPLAHLRAAILARIITD